MPLPQLALELVLGIGAALFAANAWVLLRPVVTKARTGRSVPRPPSMTRIYVNMFIGGVAAIWALATLLSHH